jgi:glycerol-3-phosphate dehydrogenase (NAD(P)+)
MKKTIDHITVIGDGSWGTTLCVYLAKKGYAVTLWGAFPAYMEKVRKNRYNSRFLPGIRIPKNVNVTGQLKSALETGDLIVFAVPSKYSLSVLKKIKKAGVDLSQKILLSVTKGITTSSLLRISQLVHQELDTIPTAVLSGPTIAMEIAQGKPSTAVVAAPSMPLAVRIQEIFNSETFRIYTNRDVVGVELGGSIKNIIAVACGVCDGLGFGTNTKAAIVTRGLAEMMRLGKALGAKEKTFSGLSGLGDLVTTCFSPRSRNRSAGERLGQGQTARAILASMSMVAEGMGTVKAVYQLSQQHQVSMPITTEVYNIIYKNKKAAKAVSDLMSRQTKPE